jgi:hypothetical protein
MSDRNGFSSGFWLGTLVGGVVGGIVGSVIVGANRRDDEQIDSEILPERGHKRPLKSSRIRTADRMEMARQSLDDKISELNNAIDAVRSSVSHVSGETIDPLIDRSETDFESPQSGSEKVSS